MNQFKINTNLHKLLPSITRRYNKENLRETLLERYLKNVDRIILQLHVSGRLLRSSDPRIKNIELTVFSSIIHEATGSLPSPNAPLHRSSASYQARYLRNQSERSNEKKTTLFNKQTLFRPFKEK